MKKRAINKRKLFIQTISVLIIATTIFFLLNGYLGFTGKAISELQPGASGKDTYLRENLDANFGSASNLKIGKIVSGIEYRSLIQFDLSSIPETNTVTEAILQLNLTSSSNSNTLEIKAYRIATDWSETESTWIRRTSSTNWTTQGGDYSEELDSINVTDTLGIYNLTITSIVRNWVSGNEDNYGILIVQTNAQNGDYKDFGSSDSSTESERPKLIVTHVSNVAPTLENYSISSTLTSPTKIGENETFNAGWSDLESDNVKIYICNSSNITYNSGCEFTEFCSSSLSNSNPATCNYTTQSSNTNNMTYYVSVCDSAGCSNVNSSTFYTNNAPVINLTSPTGGELFNQSLGNQFINFTVSDSDENSLTANIYYGSEQNSTTNTIVSNLNLTNYCTDTDSNTSTTNTCSYSWNSAGIYGDYYITVLVNDSYHTIPDSTDSEVQIRSLIDTTNPTIDSSSIESTYSGKSTQINATITEENLNSAWVAFNYTSTNQTLTNSSNIFTATFTAPTAGEYQYKIYAQDTIGNTGESSWETFTVDKPSATTQNESAPSTTLPFHVIKVSGEINATEPLEGISAYLNIPDGFTFMTGYSQQLELGNISAGGSETATWFLSTPLTESVYTLNITYTDDYSNTWTSDNIQITTTSSIGGYELSVVGYPEVETTKSYFTNAYFEQSGQYFDPDSITIKVYDPSNNLIVGPAAMTKESTGIYNYSYTVGASVTEGQWESIINATKNNIHYYAHEFWKVVGGPFDVRSIVIENSSTSNLTISLTTENTGGANKDLTLVWNLTRTDTNEQLDSGSETFMVEANSERGWTVYPITTYVGQVQITLVGYYSGTEKAGAYKIFSTTQGGEEPVVPETPAAGGGGGGGGGQSTDTTTNETIKETAQNTTNQEEIPISVDEEISQTTEKEIIIEKPIIPTNMLYALFGLILILIIILIWVVLKFTNRLKVLSIIKKIDTEGKAAKKQNTFDSKIKNIEKRLK